MDGGREGGSGRYATATTTAAVAANRYDTSPRHLLARGVVG